MPDTDNVVEDILRSTNGYDEEEANPALEIRKPGRRGPNPDTIQKVTDKIGEQVMSKFEIFLENYTEEHSNMGTQQSDFSFQIYINQIRQMKQDDRTTLYVDHENLRNHDSTLADAIAEQYYRLLPYLRRAVQNLIKKYEPTYLYQNSATTFELSSGLILRDFSVAFYGLPVIHRIRELRTEKIGSLISISGTVTRTSEVRPELSSGTFECVDCGLKVKDIEQEFKYVEPQMCQNPTCQNRLSWRLKIEQSKFVDWQRVRIQENSNEIPSGNMPRTLDVILRDEMVERAKAGDKCVFTGTVIVVPDIAQLGVPGAQVESRRDINIRNKNGVGTEGVTGLKALGVRDLTYKLSFLACMVQPADIKSGSINSRGDDMFEDDQQTLLEQLSQEEIDDLRNMVNMEKTIYSKLSKSIAPAIFGHDIVKKGILLQLMGGVHKTTPDGINLRGDINVCIVGDPSTSKSQFLKYVCGFLPRSVYTSGKASSAAGLTASVVKDEETGEFTIEAGALMLADNGICAIDEFDKMDITDQVAIHEAMEQQTISIAKAGLHATLNARTSILAAANPAEGRYNKKLTLKRNVNMSAPIMSRFDLFFVVLDECNAITDYNIARHIVNVHRLRDDFIQPEFSTAQLQRYIRYARTFKPKLTPGAAKKLSEYYRNLRQDDAQGLGKNSYRITVRQLESMIRLSEAIARAHCQEEIIESYVQEAYGLLQKSIIRVEQDEIDIEDTFDEVENQISQSENTQSEMDIEVSDLPKNKKNIPFERFEQIQNMIATKLRLVEKEGEEFIGMKRSELIDWYLEQKEDEMENEEDCEEERKLINKILKKLVKNGVLLAFQPKRDVDSDEDSMDVAKEDPTIIIHPNCELAVI